MAMEAATLQVTVNADTGNAQRGLRDVGRAVNNASQKFNALDEIVKGALRELGAASLRVFGDMSRALASFARASVDAGMDFQETMSGVEAILMPTAQDMADLTDTAVEMGSKTAFSATQAAGGIEMLGRNGLDTAQILGGALESSMSLASSTGSELAMSADVMTDAMSVFGIEAARSADAANLITGATVNSKFTLDDFRLALAQGGGVAAASGVEFNDFATTIAGISPLFGSGSDAGTSFKTMLQRLVPASGPAEEAMAELGLLAEDGSNAFFDASGNLKSMSEISTILQGALSGLSEEQKTAALSTIFGADAMRAAVGVAELGGGAFDELAGRMGEVDAQAQALTRLDNLTGDMTLMQSAVEGLQVRLFNLAEGSMRALVQRNTEVINAISAFVEQVAAADDPLYAIVTAIDTLIPGFAAMVAFVQANVQPILLTLRSALVGIGTVIAINVVPAMAAAVAAFAVVNAPVVALIGLIGLLYAAWETNFGGIRDMTVPLFAEIRDTIALAMQTVQAVITAALAYIQQLWQTHGETITNVVTLVWGIIQHQIEQKIILIQGILNTVMAAVNGDWAGAWQAIQDTALRLFEHTKEGIFGKVLELAQGVITQVQVSAPSILEGLGVWARAFVEWLAQAWAQLQPQLVTFALSIVEWVQAQVPGLIETLVAWGRVFVAWIADAIPPLLVQLGVLISNLLDWIGQQVAVIVPKLAGWAAAFAEWVIPMIPVLFGYLLELQARLLAWIVERIPTITQTLAGWALAFAEWVIADALPLLLQNLLTMAGQLLQWVADNAMPLAAKLVSEWVPAVVGWVLTDALPRLLSALGELIFEVLGWIVLRSPEIATQILEWAVAFVSWVTEAQFRLHGALSTLWLDILNWIGEKTTQVAQEMLGFGGNIVDGIRQGIADKWDEFTGWLGEQFAGLPGPVKQALGIASPSQVFANEIGIPIIQGVETGMQQQSGSMIDLMASLMGGPNQSTGLYAAAITGGAYFEEVGAWLVARLLFGMRTKWDEVRDFFESELSQLFGSIDTTPASDQGRAASRAFAEGMRREWQSLKPALYDMFTETADVMSGGAVSAFNAAAQLANTLPRILGAFRDMGGSLDELFNIGADVMGALYRGMQSGLVAIEDDAARIGAAIIDAMMQAWSEQQDGIFERATAMGQRMVEALASAFDTAGIIQAGESYVNGIIAGIDNREAALMERIRALAGGMVGTLQGSLEIASPSRVMAARVGVPIAEGIAEGITAAKPAIDMALNTATAPPAMAGGGGTTINNYDNRQFNLTNNNARGGYAQRDMAIVRSLA